MISKSKQNSRKKPIARLRDWVIAIGLGLILCELFLRALLPVEIIFETWFTPGIERFDSKLGVVYKSNWSGTMRHADGVYRGVFLKLDENGFRLPARNQLPGIPRKILMLGGRSAMMSYGLPDDEAIPETIARNLPFPAEVQSIATAGGNLMKDWQAYLALLQNEHFDLVVISHVNPNLPAYSNKEWFLKPPPTADPNWYFRFMDGIVLWRDGLIEKFGRNSFRSYLGYGLLRLTDSTVEKMGEWKGTVLSEHEAALEKQSRLPAPRGLQDYADFLTFMHDHFEKKETPVLFHLIPRRYFPENHQKMYAPAFQTDWQVIDLHSELYPVMKDNMFIANHHYSSDLANLIGNLLADEISTRFFKESPSK